MDLEVGEISMELDEDIRATGRDFDDMLMENIGKEKFRETTKHRSKAKREERDYGSRGRERSKENENNEYVGRDLDRYDAKDRDRHGKDRDRDKERNRDRLHEEEDEQDKSREERDKERGRERDRDADRSTDRDHERSHDHGRSRGRQRDKDNEIEKERDLVREHDRRKERDLDRSKIHERDHVKDVQREVERERRKEKDHEKAKEKNKEIKDHDRMKSRERDMEKTKDREKEKDKEKDRERDKGREKARDKFREKESEISVEFDRNKLRTSDREKETTRAKRSDQDERLQSDSEFVKLHSPKEESFQNDTVINEIYGSNNQQSEISTETASVTVLRERLTKMKEDRLKKKSEDTSEILSWVTKSRRIEEKKRAEMEALRLSKVFEEQDKMLDEDDEEAVEHTQKDLAGVKILHGLDKVIEGGAVVLTLKDQDILKGGDVNDDIDMLENVEIGEQKQRDAAYKAAKRRTGLYDDKFSDETGSRRAILPQYDDPVEDEGVSFDEGGHFTAEAEKKLEELRKRIEGSSTHKSFEDLTSSVKLSSDYYTTDEMLQFKKPKKKKSLRKKEKLDLDALEAEAKSAGLGTSDLGSRNDMKRQTAKEEQDKSEAEMRSKAYQAAYAKAEEASKVLRQEQTLVFKSTEDEDLVFGEDYEDLQRSLVQARKVALSKQDGAASGPLAVALAVAQLANSRKEQEQSQSQLLGDAQEDKIVMTEIGEFVLGLQLNEGTQKAKSEDIFMDEEDASKSHEVEAKADISGRDDVQETNKSEILISENKDDIAADEIIHEAPLGNGLAGALKLLRERGALKETIDWGGRTMDKKKSKLVGLNDNEGTKEIRIERTDEFGRIMTPKEAFRILSHKFHGKGPGKKKQEKRMKQYHEDLKIKQMKASDTPLLAVEKMREAQARLQTPYLVLSGHVKPGQTSDPRSGFATVEKDHLGSLTPMLGDKKVEHFLGIKRKPDAGSMGPPPPKIPKN